MEHVRDELRARHYSPRTERAYTGWVERFIRFHKMRHPVDLGEKEINEFLTHLAVVEHVSASTQTQALSALLFLYRHVFGLDVGDLGDVVRAKSARHVPVVLTQQEVRTVLN
ncbi:MAG: phage integrase N-terminal SAM-like domain-containing protein, partial [Coriobacteriales bacterium]|nr:phage integrase N-terminal SAM-like domain-containing protein [Coriobacteriales bacterium]